MSQAPTSDEGAGRPSESGGPEPEAPAPLIRNRDYMLLLFGQGVSSLGDGISQLGVLFWVFELTGRDPRALAAATAANMLPMLLGPVAGALVDRWDRKRVMIASDLVRALLVLGFLLTLVVRLPVLLYALLASVSLASRFFGPARAAAVALIVPREQFQQASAFGQTVFNSMQILAPLAGAAVYAWLGPVGAFSADAISYVVSAACVALARIPHTTGSGHLAPRQVLADLRAGFRYVRGNPVLVAVLGTVAVIFLGAGLLNVFGLPFLTDVLGQRQETLGPLSSAQGAGMLLSAVALSVVGHRLAPSRPFMASLAMLGVFFVGYALSPSVIWLFVWNPLIGLGNGALNVAASTLLMLNSEDAFRGRVIGLLETTLTLFLLLSSGVAALLVGRVPIRAALAAAGVIIALSAVAAGLLLRRNSPAARAETAAQA